MAFDAFIKFKDLPGESTDDKHKEWIETLSFHFGVSHATGGSVSGQGSLASGRADFNDFSFVHNFDKASPKLFLACATGQHIGEATFEACKSTGDKGPYLKYKFTDVMITSVRPGGSAKGDAGNLPLEEVSFNSGKVEVEYTQHGPDGKPAGTVPAGFDLKANKKV